MEKLNWMTINEMTLTNSATLMWKMVYLEKPKKVADKLEIDKTDMSITIKEPRLIFSEQNFTIRASRELNKLPVHIRTNKKLTSFKRQVKYWVKQQKEIAPD